MEGPRGGAARRARALLAAARAALARPRGAGLHDARVALRRLRVLLRSRPGRLGASEADLSRLRVLARSTNAARDAQVELGWLAEHAPAALLRRARATLRPSPPRGLAGRFSAAAALLTPRLREEDDGRFRRRPARRALRRLRRRVRRLERRATPRRLHLLRVAAKSLRYQLEPYGRRRGFPSGPSLRGLQRALGAVHDLDLILRDLARWRAPADVAGRARTQRAAALGRARRVWRGLGPG